MSSAIRLFIKFTLGGGGGGGGSFMNGSTFCEIKYIYEGIFLYMIRIGVGLKILARTPIPKLPTKKDKV